MNTEQAVEIIKQACASVQTNLQGHQQIQNAIKVVEQQLDKNKKK